MIPPVPSIGRDNPPDLAPEHLGAVELERDLNEGFEVEGLRAADAALWDLWLVDVAAEGLDASNGDWRGAAVRRVELRGCD